MRVKLASAVDLTDAGAVVRAVESTGQHDLTLSNLANKLNADKPSQLLDPAWVKNTAHFWKSSRTSSGVTSRARASAAAPRWASSIPPAAPRCGARPIPSTPIPSPGPRISFQDSPSVAMGIFEGHMAKMADGFKAVRMAEKELAGDYLPDRDEDFFRRFTGSSSPPTNGSSARRWCRSAATARCTTSVSRTCRAR
jgi:pyruvate-ferredoxin/flavodoxin oxidoreductase